MNDEEEIEYLESQNEELRKEILDLREKKDAISAALPSGSSSIAVDYSTYTSNNNVVIDNSASSNNYTTVYCPYIPLQFTPAARK